MKALAVVFLLVFSLNGQCANILKMKDYNQEVLRAINKLPKDGGYSVNKTAFKLLSESVYEKDSKLVVDIKRNGPYFCSSATYFAFSTVIMNLHNSGIINLLPTSVDFLRSEPKGVYSDDGFGTWGRWNANGPGTPVFFADTNLGINFVDDKFKEAKPGDFLKIFWNKHVGKKERGHSVVLTRVIPAGAKGRKVKKVCYWSGNSDKRVTDISAVYPGGMNERCKKRSTIKRMIFSRLTNPENINNIATIPYKNAYLESLLRVESSFKEAVRYSKAITIK